MKKYVKFLFPLALIGILLCSLQSAVYYAAADGTVGAEDIIEYSEEGFIKWVDFNPGKDTMQKVLNYHKSLPEELKGKYGFCEILSYIAAANGNRFSHKQDMKYLERLKSGVSEGKDPLSDYAENKYYRYYVQSYHAVFDGIIGEYIKADGTRQYGVRGYSPIAAGYWYSDYDDFGSSRSFGYRRRHLGHDMMGSVGTPIIAAEGGKVVALGWNRYGGWRVGIRSFDGKRYYYYAHLRKDKPYPSGLLEGGSVRAGEVIGFLGNTGYSSKENKNMLSATPHLHFGLQLIFDESQISGRGEIWIDVYALTRLLAAHNRARVVRDEETKELRSTDLITILPQPLLADGRSASAGI